MSLYGNGRNAGYLGSADMEPGAFCALCTFDRAELLAWTL